MTDVIIVLVLIGLWILINAVFLPKLGVPT